MRSFVRRVSSKISKLTPEQVEKLFDALTDENETFDAVFDSLRTGLLVCNAEWQLISANKASVRYIPLSLLFSGPPVWRLIEDKDIAEFLKSSSSSQKKYVSEHFTLTTPSGAARFIHMAIFPLVRLQKLSGAIIQIDDITEKRNQETLMRRMESLASLTNLAASVAHEIKNPLGAISIHIQLMQKAIKKARAGDGCLPPEKCAEKYLDTINEEIDRLNQIIVDFLFAVRPISAEMEPLNSTEIIAKFADFIREELREKNIKLEIDLLEKPPTIMADAKLFRQVLMNLAQNAIAAMPTGGTLWLSTTIHNERFVLNVADSGNGMDEATASRIFEPYFTTKAKGTGLGLTMVYKIIKEFSGDIDVKSFPSEGTLFTISLPLPQKERRLLEYKNLNIFDQEKG